MNGPTPVAGATGPGRRRLAVLVVWAAAIVTWLAWSRRTGSGAAEAADSLRAVLAGSAWGPLLYIGLYVLRPLILFPASVLTILGGVVFGPVAGVAYTVVGANLSSAASYGGARYLAGPREGPGPLRPPVGAGLVDRLAANPFETTLILRLAAAPFDAVGLAAGALGLRFAPFLLGSFLGTITGTIAFVSFGASIESLADGRPGFDAPLLAGSVVLAVGGIVAARVLRRRRPDVAGGLTDPAPRPTGSGARQHDAPLESHEEEVSP